MLQVNKRQLKQDACLYLITHSDHPVISLHKFGDFSLRTRFSFTALSAVQFVALG